MVPRTLRKLLDKQKTVSLLQKFLHTHGGFATCWVVEQDGRCFIGNPERSEEDFYPLLEHMGHTRDAADQKWQAEPAPPEPPHKVAVPPVSSLRLCAPIFVDHELAGAVVAQTHGQEAPQHLHRALQFLSDILSQVATLGIEKKAVALDTLDKYRELTLLYTIGETIGTCLDVDQIARLVLETNRKIIKAENSSLMLLNPHTKELEIQATSGLEHQFKVHLRKGIGIAGLVVQTGKPQIVNDTTADPRFVQHTKAVRSLICVPLKVEEKILGVINVSNKLSGEMFTARDEKLLMTLAFQTAIALENARLVLELKENNRALAAALRKVELLEKAKTHLSKFVPQLVQKIIEENPEAPELEKQDKEVSILFLDIAGYTEMSESLDQQKVNYLIERYFSSFLDDIHENNGDINETVGDGLMIIFQTPGQHVLQAAYTALAIRNKTQQINADLRGMYEPIVVNIGINTGMASVGSTKFEGITGTRWTYTASGSVTNLAARIAAFATGGSILVSTGAMHRIAEHFLGEALGLQHFKNVSMPIGVYRLLGEKADHTLASNLLRSF